MLRYVQQLVTKSDFLLLSWEVLKINLVQNDCREQKRGQSFSSDNMKLLFLSGTFRCFSVQTEHVFTVAAQRGAYVQTEVWQRTVSGSVHKLSNKYTCGSTVEDEPPIEMNKAPQEVDSCFNSCNTPARSLKLDRSRETLTGRFCCSDTREIIWQSFSFLRRKYLASVRTPYMEH